MRHLHLLFILAAALLSAAQAMAQTSETFDFTGAEVNGETVDNATDVDGVTITVTNATLVFSKGTGSTTPKYYSTGTAIRLYGGGTLTVGLTSDSYVITGIVFTFYSSSYAPTSDNCSFSTGSFDYDTYTWTGTSNTVVLTNTASSGHFRVQTVVVTYVESSGSQSSADLAFSTTSDNVYEEEISSYIAPTFTYATTADITFSSDNEDVATVDALGVVSLTGTRGTAVITATSEANDDYYAGSATYTVTVYGYKTYKKTTTIVDGSEYLIVVKDDSYTYYAYPLSSSYTYGYLYVGTVSGDVDEISVKTLYEDGFIIASVDGGYSIKDVDTERFYCQSGTYSSFQITSDAEAWTIEQQDDGTYKISMNDYYIQYSTSYSSYGIYTDEQGLMPYLYIIETDYIASAVDEVAADAEPKVYAADGKLYVDAAEGALIEVYDLTGRRIAQTTAATSNTVIDGIATGQLLIVRVDGRATKLLF